MPLSQMQFKQKYEEKNLPELLNMGLCLHLYLFQSSASKVATIITTRKQFTKLTNYWLEVEAFSTYFYCFFSIALYFFSSSSRLRK